MKTYEQKKKQNKKTAYLGDLWKMMTQKTLINGTELFDEMIIKMLSAKNNWKKSTQSTW